MELTARECGDGTETEFATLLRKTAAGADTRRPRPQSSGVTAVYGTRSTVFRAVAGRR
ncbi:hypothetical protein [Streptomyces sp. NBC_00893]|uniref:hypothetical protein n=1 Tax=Streptomyces sp. NBC_00893 TaxID=2975862 RepID=UPI00225A49DE|nr:hypothetical protein [Streptomyces sp. NBC_00893]MCX4851318.1 hypothetical protein [Streptomyces sp. NBC_00893]